MNPAEVQMGGEEQKRQTQTTFTSREKREQGEEHIQACKSLLL